uniref:Uncharacterized protein n=1 Tax=Arundo donax TaxID=35708 RepID=A0A0A9AGH0_ARUDO
MQLRFYEQNKTVCCYLLILKQTMTNFSLAGSLL